MSLFVSQEYLEMRTSLIGPSTYQLPDLWDSTVSHGIDTSSALQPVFRSTTPRFKDRKSLRSEFPEEKVGASIPHSRGRSRGGGFKELPRPMTEGEIAARLASHSISTWESFRDAPLPTFDSSASSNVLSGNPDMFNNADPDKFFELSTISRPLTGAPQREKSANNNVRSKPNSRPSLSQSTGSLLQSAPNSRGFSQRSRGSGGVLPGSRSKDSASGNGDNGGMILYNQKQRRSKSRMPGFTILSKSVTPIFDVPDYHKSYQRATLPDGTVAIIPVCMYVCLYECIHPHNSRKNNAA